MLQKYLPVFLVFLFGVLGCASTETIESTKVSATEVYQSYVIKGNKFSCLANATFRVSGMSGSTIDLDAPAKIEHNGKEMNESAPGFMKGTDYFASSNQFVASHKFKFTDADGKAWENEISLEPLEITSQNLSISRENGGVFTISRPVGKEETVEFSLVSDKQRPVESNSNADSKSPQPIYSKSLYPNFDQSGKTATIEGSILKDFVEGKASLQVTVRKSKTDLSSAKGGKLEFTYESQVIPVKIVN